MTSMKLDNDALERTFLISAYDVLANNALDFSTPQCGRFFSNLGSVLHRAERVNKHLFTVLPPPQTGTLHAESDLTQDYQGRMYTMLTTSHSPPLESHLSSHLRAEPHLKGGAGDYALTAEIDHARKPHKHPETWWFSSDERTLVNAGKKISLTGIESLLLKQLALSDRRVCSKTDLILGINRDPEHYRGLEMCLSRLQEKFSDTANGERLFRSVRNRGYCLVQKIRATY